MKLLVFSDSHGKAGEVSRMMRKAEVGGKPDMVLFAGDGVYDALDLRYEGYLVRAVRGNCDLGAPPDIREEMILTLNSVTLYLCHGHRLQVKQGLGPLYVRAEEVGASLAIFGHTHHQTLEARNGILLLNPGTLRNGEYALVTLSDEGAINCQLFG
ncbi:MAG: metallophosphoesterase family protein [Christensenellales bacterium]|jgi:putative phosphoesterase